MILKSIPKRSKSSFKRLAAYLCTESKDNRIGYVTADNEKLEKDDWKPFASKIEARQRQKAGQGKDLTSHFLISFTPEEYEKMDDDKIKEIEERVVAAVGLNGHDRISAFHTDTNNPHLHIAVSHLDAENRIKEPFKAHKKLKNLRHEISKEYGFELVEDSQISEGISSDGAGKIEAHSVDESFETWLKANIKVDIKELIKTGTSWGELHSMLAKKGVVLKKQGAGLVFCDASKKVFVKASSVHRDFSLGKLEKKLGVFELVEDSQISEVVGYSGGKKKNSLYEEYQASLLEKRRIRSDEREKAKELMKERGKRINSDYRGKKQLLFSLNKVTKDKYLRLENRVKMKVLDGQKAVERERNFENYQKTLVGIKEKIPHLTWGDFLFEQARAGDLRAIEGLRKRSKQKVAAKENSLAGKSNIFQPGGNLRDYKYTVERNGDLSYKTEGGAGFVDKGTRLVLGNEFDLGAIDAALKLASSKYGKGLKIKGNHEFLAAVKSRAKALMIDVKTESVDKAGRER